jgi:peroxiredoxin (alkyl hydroperoxide reductase subunit C)
MQIGWRLGVAIDATGKGTMTIQIGERTPDFKAEAYYRGGVEAVELSRYRGQWVVLLFYPADFTFV